MKIFDFCNNETEFVVTILNKKFIYKKIDDIYESIFLYWNNKGIDNNLISKLEMLYFNPKYHHKKYKKLWLIYATCLLKINQEQNALKVLQNYVNEFGYIHIEKFIPLAWLANKYNITSANIKLSAELFELFENKKNWLDYIKDKKIAIVGNGANLIGKNMGNEIDKHEVVIRFNQFKTTGFENDCGKKTNMWVTHTTLKEENFINNFDYIILNYKYWNNIIEPERLKNIVGTNKNIGFIDFDSKKHTKNLLMNDFYEPTTGCALICKLLENLKDFDNIDFYGFGFLDKKFKPLDHYYQKVSKRHQQKAEIMHSFSKECSFLKDLVSKNKK